MRFAANLDRLFAELPFPDRFAAAAREGFEGVELARSDALAPAELAARLNATGLELALLVMAGGASGAGAACLPDGAAAFRAEAARAIDLAASLGCGRILCPAPALPAGLDRAVARAAFAERISAAAAEAEDEGIELLIAPVPPADEPGTLLGDLGAALALIAGTGETGTPPGLLLDIRASAAIHGPEAVAGWIRRCRIVTGHYRIAGIPGGDEPDRGALPLAAVLAAIRAETPGLWVGADYDPAGPTASGLGWLRRARR